MRARPRTITTASTTPSAGSQIVVERGVLQYTIAWYLTPTYKRRLAERKSRPSEKSIVAKAIQRVIDSEWEFDLEFFSGNFGFIRHANKPTEVLILDSCQYTDFIFNHDFAKALWGEDRYGRRSIAVKGGTFHTVRHQEEMSRPE